jgi:menaquinone-dependent protoporphyrinogen oxidase
MASETVSRRRFLALAGAGAGALAAGYAELALTPEQQPVMEMPEVTCGDQNVKDRILVTYASRTGSTAGVAEAIGRTLAESAALRGQAVDVRPMTDVKDLAPYGAVVLGSAVQGGAWLPEAMQFLEEHRGELARVPCASFLVCMTMATKNPSYRQGVTGWMTEVRSLVRPVSEGLFAGALDIKRIPSLGDRVKFRLSVMTGIWSEGDHRDWNAIRAWAEDVAPRLAA